MVQEIPRHQGKQDHDHHRRELQNQVGWMVQKINHRYRQGHIRILEHRDQIHPDLRLMEKTQAWQDPEVVQSQDREGR